MDATAHLGVMMWKLSCQCLRRTSGLCQSLWATAWEHPQMVCHNCRNRLDVQAAAQVAALQHRAELQQANGDLQQKLAQLVSERARAQEFISPEPSTLEVAPPGDPSAHSTLAVQNRVVWQAPRCPHPRAVLLLSPPGLAQLLCHAQGSHLKLHRQYCCVVRAIFVSIKPCYSRSLKCPLAPCRPRGHVSSVP